MHEINPILVALLQAACGPMNQKQKQERKETRERNSANKQTNAEQSATPEKQKKRYRKSRQQIQLPESQQSQITESQPIQVTESQPIEIAESALEPALEIENDSQVQDERIPKKRKSKKTLQDSQATCEQSPAIPRKRKPAETIECDEEAENTTSCILNVTFKVQPKL